jgi:hypothetical protein
VRSRRLHYAEAVAELSLCFDQMMFYDLGETQCGSAGHDLTTTTGICIASDNGNAMGSDADTEILLTASVCGFAPAVIEGAAALIFGDGVAKP